MVKILTVLVSTISNLQILLLKKNVRSTHFFSKNISVYVIFNDQRFNDTLTNDIVSFEQQYKNQGPVVQSIVSLTNSLVVKLLIVLASKMSKSQVFLLKHMSKCKSFSHFLQQKY